MRHILFLINEQSGKKKQDCQSVIINFFDRYKECIISFLQITAHIKYSLNQYINEHEDLDTIVAVGGDGTINLVTKYIIHSKINLGILPTGSANGLARDLGIKKNINIALQHIYNNSLVKISVIKVLNGISIHLADIGANAQMIRLFESTGTRGFRGYLFAALRVWTSINMFQAEITIDDKTQCYNAVMMVIANGKTYGTGYIINPFGALTDDKMELIIIRQFSLLDLIRYIFNKRTNKTEKIEVHSGKKFIIKLSKAIHFQIDGEYLGKYKEIKAEIMSKCLSVIVPSK